MATSGPSLVASQLAENAGLPAGVLDAIASQIGIASLSPGDVACIRPEEFDDLCKGIRLPAQDMDDERPLSFAETLKARR